jgi:hypothetical protein
MLSLRRRVETWIGDHTARVEATWQIPVLPGLPTWKGWQWQWPPWKGREEEKRRIREELELRRKQLQELCRAVKVESVADLQEVLCCMVLAECVYKVQRFNKLIYSWILHNCKEGILLKDLALRSFGEEIERSMVKLHYS